MIIITNHTGLVGGNIYEGTVNTIIETLIGEEKDFIFVRHSMEGGLPSMIYTYKQGKLIGEKKLFVISRIGFLRYISEVFSTLRYFIFNTPKGGSVYIGVDPLNAFTGVLLKKFGKVKKTIFYTLDYSPQRFTNKILDYIYHRIDQFCVKYADETWNVSSRIFKIREDMKISAGKNIFLPNIPSEEYKKYFNNKKQKFHLISLGIIGSQFDYFGIFDAIEALKSIYPELLLEIIGNGPKEDEYKKYVVEKGMSENIKFLGYLDHEAALEKISNAGIGLALYNGSLNFNYYGDSLKCREYFCFGLPVVTTDTHSTVDEIKEYNAGIVCEMNKDEYKDALIKIFENYELYSQNAYRLARKYEGIHAKILTKICLN
jgi:glycosyltransferase involved in cell wall biosynthesis